MTETLTLDQDAFMRLVTQEHLQVEGPTGGYLYTGKQGLNGWELFKTPDNPWWYYQDRRVTTNANAAGAAITVDISVPAGVVMEILHLYADQTTVATHTLSARILDEDNAIVSRLASVAAAASNNLTLPSLGSVATTSSNVGSGRIWLSPGMKLSVFEAEASANANDVMTIGFLARISVKTAPIWDKSRSGNAANTTIADSTISAANTWQQVAMP